MPDQRPTTTMNVLGDYVMKYTAIKRSIVIDGRRTTTSLEREYWSALRQVAAEKAIPLSALIKEVARKRKKDRVDLPLASSIRVFLLKHFRRKATRYGLSG
jgi:predicted DNA-binding ribbon-helix-helix protein